MQVAVVAQSMELARKHMLHIAADELDARKRLLLPHTLICTIQIGERHRMLVRVNRLRIRLFPMAVLRT